jgi:predicted O-linked N-acetylglucosamine transferase (SPINDLY family)
MTVEPKLAQTYCGYGELMGNFGDLDQAIRCYRGAIAMQENLAEAHHRLGNALYQQAKFDEALSAYTRASELKPQDANWAGDRLMVIQNHPAFDAEKIQTELKQWDLKYAQPLAPPARPAKREHRGRLRVGYVSPDFREHELGWSLLPLLSNHHRARFEIFGYSSVIKPDGMTEKLSAKLDAWRDIADLNDQQAAELIASDGIDVLVDLSQHGEGNRLLVFARKPAAVQMTYLGYAGTTGMAAMGYRLSDPYLDPQDCDDRSYSEKPIWLPRTYWCYEPRGATPEVGAAPAEANGYVTFGCLAEFTKSAAALGSWADLLVKVADSRIILKCPVGSPREQAMEIFTARGVAKERVKFVGEQPWELYIQTLGQIDIALDPFPFCGRTSTCDALWMGVPVVSLSGTTPPGRMGKSILSNVGLADLVADSMEDYLRIAGETEKLIALRPILREKMLQSPLMDIEQFVTDFEAALEQMAGAKAT